MPIYEYNCKNCSKDFEIIQKISDPPAKKCPTCGKKIEKKLSLSSFQLKGTGWYVTDFAKKGKENKSEKKETKAETKAEAKPDSSSKPESKTKKSSDSD